MEGGGRRVEGGWMNGSHSWGIGTRERPKEAEMDCCFILGVFLLGRCWGIRGSFYVSLFMCDCILQCDKGRACKNESKGRSELLGHGRRSTVALVQMLSYACTGAQSV